jgi:predicted metal-binding membrane protein
VTTAGPPPALAGDGPSRATLVTYALLLALAALAWIDVVRSASGMEDMAGMEMAMAPSLSEAVFFVVAWTVMMAAMMLPSASPMIALYAATQRSAPSPAARAAAVAQFTLVYVLLWAATGVPIYFLMVVLGGLSRIALAYGVAVVLIVAGAFQLSPLKQVCLRHCRSPLGFLLGCWRPGWRGAWSMGGAHALYCLGCCWGLMLVLVVAGAMGLAWVLLIAALVLAEKLVPGGDRLAWISGAVLVMLGVAVALRPELAMLLRAGPRSM